MFHLSLSCSRVRVAEARINSEFTSARMEFFDEKSSAESWDKWYFISFVHDFTVFKIQFLTGKWEPRNLVVRGVYGFSDVYGAAAFACRERQSIVNSAHWHRSGVLQRNQFSRTIRGDSRYSLYMRHCSVYSRGRDVLLEIFQVHHKLV